MSNLKIFNNNEFGDIRTLDDSGKTLFCGSDVAKALGYDQPHKAVERHCKDGGTFHTVIDSLGREQNAKFITEGNLYRLIVNSKLPSAEKFEHWVFDEVLPTIRKQGIYATDKVLDEMIASPEYGIRLLSELKAERDKLQILELENVQNKQIICELQPKASYYDMILQNKSVMPMSTIAKDYGMSARGLNALLHDLGIQFKMGDRWFLYQKYADYGYTHSQPHLINEHHSVMHMFWTQKGRLFLYDFLKNRCGILPAIERLDDFEQGETSWA